MEKIKSFLKSKELLVAIVVVSLAVGLFVKNILQEAPSPLYEEKTPESPALGEVLEKEEFEGQKMNVIEKNVGDEIELATIKFKVNSAEEKQVLSSKYGTPAVTKENAKFLVIDMDITNITNTGFTLFPDEGFRLVDNKNREFTTYENTFLSVDNYLNVRELAPSIKENGVLVYEIPKDATIYSLVVGKAGINEIYKVLLGPSKGEKETQSTPASPELTQQLPEVYNLGDRIQIEDVVVEVISFTDYEVSSEFLKPKTGNKYVTAEISITNIGTEYIDYSPLMFILRDKNKRTYPLAIAQKQPMIEGTLKAWGKTLGSVGIGFLTWEVPKDISGLQLIISFPWFAERPIVNLGK